MEALPKVGEHCNHDQAQALAIKAALLGAGRVSPNPLVGCVVLSPSGKLLATGFHPAYGQAHAEVTALDKLPIAERAGATVYVTLEPCSHYGKTPPCCDRLIQDKVKKVVIGVQDPNPLVAGKGIEKLKSAGIQVELDTQFSIKAEKVAEHFLCNMRTQKPFVTLKLAMSLDGQLALENGESQWLTSDESRIYARQLRSYHDATLVGAQTILQDDPVLDFRETELSTKPNQILIWDPKNKLESFLPKAKIVKTHTLKNIHIFEDINEAVLKELYRKGITSIFVEGGAKTLSYFIEQGLFNKIHVFIAPVILGKGRSWTSSIELNNIQQKLPLEFTETVSIGKDIFITAYPKP